MTHSGGRGAGCFASHRRGDRGASSSRLGLPREDYQEALCLELEPRHIAFERERAVMVSYKGYSIPGQRIDLVVAGKLVVELKAVDRIDPTVEARLISYLRTTRHRLGLVLNFNARAMKDGMRRVVV